MRKIERLSVLVHPHYLSFYSDTGRIETHRLKKLPLKEKLRPLAAGDEELELRLKEMDAVHRMYKKDVDHIAKSPGEFLVILKSVYGQHDDEVRHLTKEVPEEAAFDVWQHGQAYQEKLVEYAKKKLGNRFLVTETAPGRAGTAIKIRLKKLKKQVSVRIPVRVWGEFREACVGDTHASLVNAGFRKAKIDFGRSLPGEYGSISPSWNQPRRSRRQN